MATRYTRQEFLDRLWAEIKRGKPLVMTGAGNGIGRQKEFRARAPLRGNEQFVHGEDGPLLRKEADAAGLRLGRAQNDPSEDYTIVLWNARLAAV